MMIISILVAFFLGSIPTGFIIAKKFKGIDIRDEGSGNIGSTNMRRVLGKKLSLATQVGDIAKGMIPVLIAMLIYDKLDLVNISYYTYISSVAIAAILGHNFTPFLSFKGGKGVNTTIGSFFLINPIAVLSGAFVYFALKVFTRIVSIRSMALGATIPVVCIIMRNDRAIIIATALSALLIIIRHKDNIIRIIQKKEL